MPIPDGWADPAEGLRIWRRDQDWGQLRARYERLGPSTPLNNVFSVVEDLGATHALQEQDYIDADYRDEFANFYASTFPPYPDRCERLHFLDETKRRYLGYCVIRPVPGRPVCRTVIGPPDELAEHVSCVTTSRATPYGYPLAIRGFPFIGQDHQYGVCAHASIWMTSLFHHLENRRDRYHLSDMVRAAGARQESDRLVPSSGLTLPQMASVFRAIRLPASFYRANRLPDGEDRARIVCRYLNSRLPVVVATGGDATQPGHAVALIGYRRADKGDTTFIGNDDAAGPYREGWVVGYDDVRSGDWRGILIGLPGRIYLPGESAEKRGRRFFEGMLRREQYAELREQLSQDRFRIRSYVTEAAQYKRNLPGRGLPDPLLRALRNVSLSHWVWVVELQERSLDASGESVIGEAVLDAEVVRKLVEL